MPFDYEQYQQKCDGLTNEQLQKEWDNYTRQIAGASTSTATSVLFTPLTAGVSLIGLGISAPRIHNARKKRAIIEAGLNARGETTNTRKRDVIAPMAIAGTLSGLTLGLAGPGADMLAGEAVGKGAEYVVAHAALDGAGAVMEHKHDSHHLKQSHAKLEAQVQSFQKQYGVNQQGQPIQVQQAQQIQYGVNQQGQQVQIQQVQTIQQGFQAPQIQVQQPQNVGPGIQPQTYVNKTETHFAGYPISPSGGQVQFAGYAIQQTQANGVQQFAGYQVQQQQLQQAPYQPQGPSQDQKYNYVPQASEPPPPQYSAPPQQMTATTTTVTTAQNDQQGERVVAQVSTTQVQQNPADPGLMEGFYPSSCPTPLPLYSQPQSATQQEADIKSPR